MNNTSTTYNSSLPHLDNYAGYSAVPLSQLDHLDPHDGDCGSGKPTSPRQTTVGRSHSNADSWLSKAWVRTRGDMDPESSHGRRARRALATRTEKLYMSIAGAEALIVGVVAWTYFGLIQANVPAADARTRTVPVYVSIFIFAQLFSLVYVYDALRARNVIQLVLHTFFNICILIYSSIQITQTRTALSGLGPDIRCGSYPRCTGANSLFNDILGLFIVTPVVVGLATIGYALLIRKLYAEFGWAEFRLVGASPDMKRMHRQYQTLVSLLKLLFFFATSFCIAFLILVIRARENQAEFIITIIALPVTPMVILACGYAVRKESLIAMTACLFAMAAGLAYFIYKLASMFLPYAQSLYINTRVTMVLFACFAIIILVLTIIYGFVCMANFGKGLVQAHMDPSNKTSLWSIPDQMSRAADERASRFTAGSSHGHGGEEGKEARQPEQNRLVID